MFDSTACGKMKLGSQRVSIAALDEVRVILTELGFHASAAAIEAPQEEHADAASNTSENIGGVSATISETQLGTRPVAGRKKAKRRRRGVGTTSTGSRARGPSSEVRDDPA